MATFFSKLMTGLGKRSFLKGKNDALPKDFKDKYRSASTDTGELMDDIFKSAKLHRELLVRYHPDLYPDPDKKLLADELCKAINENRRNYKRLMELQAACERGLD